MNDLIDSVQPIDSYSIFHNQKKDTAGSQFYTFNLT